MSASDERAMRSHRLTFWSNVSGQDADGCWLWTGPPDKGGYGRYGDSRAHRVAYLLTVGSIPDGLVIDYLCRVPACVNPAHLEAVTNAENVRRQFAAYDACRNGHPYSPENTMRRPLNGRRVCLTCKKATWRRWYHGSRNGD